MEREVYTAEKSKLMSQKKSLEEQSTALENNERVWLEPFKEWINTAKNAGKIAVSGSLNEKKVLASKIFGSNLVLDRKKARGCCGKPWSLLVENQSSSEMVRTRGLEPPHLSVPDPKSGASAIPPRALNCAKMPDSRFLCNRAFYLASPRAHLSSCSTYSGMRRAMLCAPERCPMPVVHQFFGWKS